MFVFCCFRYNIYLCINDTLAVGTAATLHYSDLFSWLILCCKPLPDIHLNQRLYEDTWWPTYKKIPQFMWWIRLNLCIHCTVKVFKSLKVFHILSHHKYRQTCTLLEFNATHQNKVVCNCKNPRKMTHGFQNFYKYKSQNVALMCIQPSFLLHT